MQPSVERRLLLIEDDPDLRELLPEALERAGYHVTVVDSTAAARTELQRSGFDLVLSDFRVSQGKPDLVWQQLAGLQELAGPAPVGIFTAWHLEAREVRDRGFAFLLHKPFRIEELFEQVSKQLPREPVSDAHADVIRGYFDALGRGAWSELAAMCTEDVVYQLPGDDPRHGRTVTGRAAFAAFSAEIFADFAEARFEVEAIHALPRGLLARFRSSWRAPSGERAHSEGVVLFELRDDQIAQIGVRTDLRVLTAASA